MSRGFSLGALGDTTESSEMVFLASKKAAEQQQLLSSTLLENAQLKQAIAARDAENASLTLEINSLRSKIESSMAREDSSVLQSLLDSANEEIVSLKSELAKARSSLRLHESSPKKELQKHKAELRRARAEIARLTEKNDEADQAISKLEKSLREREQTPKASNVDEMEYLRRENRELKLRIAALEGRNETNNDENKRVRTQIKALTNTVGKRMTTFETAIENEISDIKEQLSGIETSVTSHNTRSSNTSLDRLSAGIKAIQELSRKYAESNL